VAQGLHRSYDCLKEEDTSYKMQRPSHNQDVRGEDQFGFRRGKATRDAIGMLRIIAE
jgi:hypothetical protein